MYFTIRLVVVGLLEKAVAANLVDDAVMAGHKDDFGQRVF